MKEIVCNAKDVIFHQGDVGQELYQVLEGKVRICYDMDTEQELLLTDLKAGDFFGEMAIIEKYPRSASAVAVEDGTKLLVINAEEAEEWLEKDPEKAFALMDHIGNRIRALSKDCGEVKDMLSELGADTDGTKKGRLIDRIKKHIAYAKASRTFEKGESEEARSERKSYALENGFSKNVFDYSKGTLIFREGDYSECMYAVHAGSVGIYAAFHTPEEKKLITLTTGMFFGEMGMIVGKPRSATAITLEDNTVVEKISHEDMKELFEKNPPKAASIINHLSYRLRTLTIEYADACSKLVEYDN